MPKGKNPSPVPSRSPSSAGFSVTPWTSASSEVPPCNIGSDIIAAPALDPDSRPPASWAARIAARAGEGTPPGSSAARIFAWSPPVK